ncbi:MAG: pseudouridine synthase [Bacteroidota bacterium]
MKRPPATKKTAPDDNDGKVRINRYISMCGLASRRKADELVTEGKVRVNGTVMLDLGFKIDPAHDRVSVDGKQAVIRHENLYLVMNKPKDTITTLSDERGRTTVMSLVKTKQRVYPIGRLDRNTTGVLLLTSDGEFANRLMHPKFEVSKSYLVTSETQVKPVHLEKIAKGVALDDGKTAPAEVFVIPGKRGKEVGIIIHEGRNRQVRKMFELFGYEIKKLDRVAYGPITKDGLARGEVRSLSKSEVRSLKKLAGIKDEID